MSIFDELNLGARRLPVITASEAAECGLACIAMISRYHGHDVDLNGLRQRHAISLAGASLKSLMEITDQLGFSTRALRVELPALGKIRTPAILHWDLNHFVVLKSVGRKRIVIHDPAIGLRAFTREEFSKHFTGVVLELARAETFEPVSARAPMKLSMLWSKMTGWGSALVQVLILSVALQIAAFVAPLQMQLVVDEAIASVDRDLLTVIALGFGAIVIIQASIEALRSWALQGVRSSAELPGFRQSGAPPAALAERLFREAPRRRHHFAAGLGEAHPGRHHARRRRHGDRWPDGLHRGDHPVLLLGDAGADRHRRGADQHGRSTWRCFRA